MKKKGFMAISVIMATLISCVAFMTGCLGLFGGDDADPEPQTYIIQYADDDGTHQITVTEGMPYALESVPKKTGYTFNGLYDAATGGIQYISSSGSSLSPFADGKNMVLYPQFTAKNFTVVLDFQGAAVVGSRQYTVDYDSSLPELPTTLTLANKEFAGWYTEEDCEGKQIADEYGLVPLVSVLNENNFDINSSIITLYAGFKTATYTVTCHFGEGVDSEEVKVEHGTSVSDIAPKTRVEGKAPLTWSKTSGGTVFTGTIESDTELYAVEYAPVIEFDTNGGNRLNPLIARGGTTISLPTPTKDLAKFCYWEDMQGKLYTSLTMPTTSISLKAIWQAKIVFDSNGGSEVNDISESAGSRITLSPSKRDGYVFAGWYTKDKELYTSTSMPSAGISLKAGWYSELNQTIVVRPSSSTEIKSHLVATTGNAYGPTANLRTEVDLSRYLPSTGGNIAITLHMDMRTSGSVSGITDAGVYIYDDSVVSDSNLLVKLTDTVSSQTKKSYTFNAEISPRSNIIYFCYYSKKIDTSINNYVGSNYSDIWFEMTYPDTSTLHL